MNAPEGHKDDEFDAQQLADGSQGLQLFSQRSVEQQQAVHRKLNTQQIKPIFLI